MTGKKVKSINVLETSAYSTNYIDKINNEITVVVPTLNEEEAISGVLDDILTQGYDKILVVDGLSLIHI